MAISSASGNEESVSTPVYLAIMKGLERLLLADVLTTSDADAIMKLSVDRWDHLQHHTAMLMLICFFLLPILKAYIINYKNLIRKSYHGANSCQLLVFEIIYLQHIVECVSNSSQYTFTIDLLSDCAYPVHRGLWQHWVLCLPVCTQVGSMVCTLVHLCVYLYVLMYFLCSKIHVYIQLFTALSRAWLQNYCFDFVETLQKHKVNNCTIDIFYVIEIFNFKAYLD